MSSNKLCLNKSLIVTPNFQFIIFEKSINFLHLVRNLIVKPVINLHSNEKHEGLGSRRLSYILLSHDQQTLLRAIKIFAPSTDLLCFNVHLAADSRRGTCYLCKFARPLTKPFGTVNCPSFEALEIQCLRHFPYACLFVAGLWFVRVGASCCQHEHRATCPLCVLPDL